jgi:hypothetical protein
MRVKQVDNIKRFFPIFFSMLCFNCNKISPAGFWKNFDSSHLIRNVSSQGPWGGHRIIYWKNLSKEYQTKQIIDFSSSNKCNLLKMSSLDNIAAKKWLEDHAGNIASDQKLSKQYINDVKGIRCQNGEKSILFTFDSHWVLVEGDTSKMAPGYVLLSPNRKQLLFYHKWGE